jgi:hypothetical protein
MSDAPHSRQLVQTKSRTRSTAQQAASLAPVDTRVRQAACGRQVLLHCISNPYLKSKQRQEQRRTEDKHIVNSCLGPHNDVYRDEAHEQRWYE